MARAFLVVLVAATAATVVACSLNPQPLPPEDTNGFNSDAGATKDSSPTSADGSTPRDGATDLDAAVIDATPDARSDGDVDAGDASDAAQDAVTE